MFCFIRTAERFTAKASSTSFNFTSSRHLHISQQQHRKSRTGASTLKLPSINCSETVYSSSSTNLRLHQDHPPRCLAARPTVSISWRSKYTTSGSSTCYLYLRDANNNRSATGDMLSISVGVGSKVNRFIFTFIFNRRVLISHVARNFLHPQESTQEVHSPL
jgi:hypothetical protein